MSTWLAFETDKDVADDEIPPSSFAFAMSAMPKYLEDAIATKNFGLKDFLCSRSSPVVDVEDIRETLEMYVQQIQGEVVRKKYFKSKVDKIENSLTPSGLKKLSDIRKEIRMLLEEEKKSSQRFSETPSVGKDATMENYDFDDEHPEQFIQKMHNWGNCSQEDCRYYLHMVFRYYFKEYHDFAVMSNVVIEHPSYQQILDNLYPNGCANKFPPEFRHFLIDSSRRYIKTESLPVPVKGSATNVSYEKNFEKNKCVSCARQRIQGVLIDWKNRIGTTHRHNNIYPSYLRQGDPFNGFIVERLCFSRKVKDVRDGLNRLHNAGVDECGLDTVLETCSKARTVYDEYTNYVFKSGGEQLMERMGFFMRSSYRKIFFTMDKVEIIEDVFKATGSGMEVFLGFEAFCSARKKSAPMPHEKDKDLTRSLLMTIVGSCSLLNSYANRNIAVNEPRGVIKDAVLSISQNQSSRS